ncbi:stress response protein NST1 [Drosophila mauritiana]|uniref:Stress response protein NST1 n=1 Tax=Drosophila mauritiana TaxID=7226 RepID=A0A6P8KMI2_DROMA|nr:stress response protein NST1 [Drosophila mauritiana]
MCLVATRVAGETMIEVDENGDEYELKRFYIQGRQLKGDGSQSQCVVTRRKRSGRAAGSGSGSAATLSVTSQPLKVESLPAKEHREGGAVLQEVESNSNRRYVALTGVHLESPLPQGDVQHDDNDDDDEEDDDGDDQSSRNQSNFVPAALALPLQSQSTAAHLNQGVSVVANAASHANVAEDAGIVVVQSHQPPKVNPDTHAVFELKPVQSDVVHQSAGVSFYPFVQPWEVVDQDEDDYDEDDYDEEDYDDFYYGGNGFYRDQPGFNGLGVFEEEIISEDQPVSTIASWSTGDDDSDILPAVNKRPNQKNKNKKNQKQKQKNKNQQQKNKRQQQKKRKQQAQNDEQPAKQKKKPQQQDKDQKKKQDKDQKKKKPEENPNQQEMEQLTPVEVIKKPVEQSVVASSATSGSNIAASSSGVSSSGSNSSDKKKNKKKKKKPSSSSSSSLSQRRTKKKKKQSNSSSSSSISISSSNKRRRPSNSIGSSSSSSSIGGYRRRRPQQQQLQQQRRRKTQQRQKRRRQQQQQKRRRQQQQQQRRRLRNKNRQFYGDEPIINCIYINKDPATTTTTPRPFWNILGRQSDSKPSAESSVVSSEESQTDPVAQQAVLQAVRRNFGEFGGRKRTNLRFVS